ncbi:MAG: IclR family transcriptional regulator C-terminal domain-containing protein, partial [Candidatus Bathyarchaeia archaeon]
KRVPPHCTALGKVLLAYNPEVLEELLTRGPLPALTPNTITDPHLLRKELERVRQQGYALDWEEFHEGNICIAAPVFNYRGHVVAAISVSFLKTRLTHDALERFIREVLEKSQYLSQTLGYSST